MKLAVLFSGGKDSTYAAFLAKKFGHQIGCLITLNSKNKESFMFHTPSIEITKKQAELMEIPQIFFGTNGKKEKELKDLKSAIKMAIKDYKIEGIVTGAVESVYQASRIQNICSDLEIECFNPLWQKDQIELLQDLLKKRFKIILTGVFAYPLDKNWVGREIDEKIIKELKVLRKEYKINPAGEGGEFESLVLSCPLFKESIKVKKVNPYGEGNSWRGEIEVE